VTVSVVVVGAGPAGLMAAREATMRGAQVILVDEAVRPGGQIYRQSAAGDNAAKIGLATERARKQAVLDAFSEIAHQVEYLPGAAAYSLFPGPELHVAYEGATRELRPDAMVLATGVSERGIPFPGWTLPGVMFAGGVQATLKAHGVRAGDRVVVTGAGPLPVAVAAQLVEAGAQVQCVALVHSLRAMLRRPAALWAGRELVREGMDYLRVLSRAGVEVLDGWVPVRADGEQRIERVTIARHSGDARPISGTERVLDCDLLAMNFGFVANSELARMAGAEIVFEPHRGGWIPRADAFGRTAAQGVLVAGDGAGLRGARVAAAEGRITGAAAVAVARGESMDGIEAMLGAEFAQRRRHEHFQQAVQEALRIPDGAWSWANGETICCRCECVTRSRIERAISDGHTSLNALKRNTRAGMGWCGGRMCAHTLAALTAGGRLDTATVQMTPRPVARLVTFAEVANRVDGG
jgi:D-hydroxyproline dehydrogenase subunit alpha